MRLFIRATGEGGVPVTGSQRVRAYRALGDAGSWRPKSGTILSRLKRVHYWIYEALQSSVESSLRFLAIILLRW